MISIAMAKLTVEECLGLDVNWLNRQGMLRPGTSGTVRWYRGKEEVGSIRVRALSNAVIELSYLFDRRELICYEVGLTWTPCHFGGQRPWFICPGCGKRVGKLYAPGKYFLCRYCYDLAYQSQRESRGDRLLRRARKLRGKLGLKPWEPIVEKPPRMHWKTFLRLREEILWLELEALKEIHREIDRLAKRVDKLFSK